MLKHALFSGTGRRMKSVTSMPPSRVYGGLFLVTFATLAFEILLTRIFSVTMWHHYAFIAISVAMFGTTAGAIAVYLRPSWFHEARTELLLAWSATILGLSMMAAVAAHLAVPEYLPGRISTTYLVTLVPFIFSGVCVCLALTRYAPAINRLYAIDLAGAALGCVGYVAVLTITDGASAVLATAALAIGAGFVFTPPRERALKRGFAALFAATLFVGILNHVSFVEGKPLLGIKWIKQGLENPAMFERWNSFSRITVHRDAPSTPVLWGASPSYSPDRSVNQLWLRMDGLAGTLLTEFKGDLKDVDYLQYDITNLVHHLRPGGRTLVIGAGGGRDVLSALLFGAPEVVGIEVNELILDTVNRRYGDFTGHLDRLPGVHIVNDEARSWAQRTGDSFDVIQVSWIDTFAATASGVLALTENSLYTVEAWHAFFDRLTPRGVLTFTRAFDERNQKEGARLASLAREALLTRGIKKPADHVMLVVNQNAGGAAVMGNATILVSPSPFTTADVAAIRRICNELGFRLVASPGFHDSSLPVLSASVTGEGLDEISRGWPYRLDAPTDDRPFFFNFLSFRRMWETDNLLEMGGPSNILSSLLGLLGTVTALSLVCLISPLFLAGADVRPRRADVPRILFFGAIGLGFMFVEIALLQRLSSFLGQPAFGVGIVLFGILLSSGAGSYLTGRISRPAVGPPLIGALVVLLVVEALALPAVIGAAQSHPLPIRIAVSLLLLLPLGLLMGTAFPLGAKVAADGASRIFPWLWGINGAASVLASVVAVLISLEAGIVANLWVGAACYLFASAMLIISSSSHRV